MLGGARRIVDPRLGELARRGRAWRGQMTIGGHAAVPVVLPGGRSGPDDRAVAMLVAVVSDYQRIRPLVRDALVDHGADGLSAGAITRLEVPDPVYATVINLDRRPTVELGFRVDWDDEHTLGARIRDGELVELCGSVLAP